ncbi:hypothetical protein G4359_08555 [Dorea longicatena]|uniref:phage scaffolding protein n=1 Tax=Dorea longicatena TaxID=88431 RepID=UPI00156DD4DA|nr:phage scaffolding protein [Dorea longicatena]NSC50234.1 hypothetical protein [Dorea longicatena]NSD26285.1 hypothetical protein [Dorea longicatena]NSD41726.1 hypothetical protein [Dorea longicatena]NSD70955.1 hypothetical protein [Dorea longicatena]NSD73802.1 hypothetical protein [Dorea longicatena]
MTLEELLKAQGLSDEQIKAITASMKENKIYTASEENLDIRYGKLKTDYDTLNTQHGESTKLIEQLKKDAKNDEALQGKITAYETQVANLQKELDETRLESAIKVALMNAKTDDVGYMAFKLKEGGALELDEDGNIKGIDEKISNLKTQFPTHFDSENNPGPREIDPKPLPEGDHNNDVQPKNLADALRMQYEENEK